MTSLKAPISREVASIDIVAIYHHSVEAITSRSPTPGPKAIGPVERVPIESIHGIDRLSISVSEGHGISGAPHHSHRGQGGTHQEQGNKCEQHHMECARHD